ncbi:IS256 family transposase [Ruminococcus sp. NK3A76]|uniref:IS256 family transposase n=1 Tax=Ruminococcus sp. NK3A76 TaxID=877411 RepID=UPI00048B3445|nr:IS256 family transposase [Ruminococcus sp. NK3A76]
MARRKREPMSEGKKNIIGMLLEEYDIKSAKDIEDALKDLLGGTIQEMLESEMDEHLGYQEYERSDNPDSRNGKKTKKIRGSFGETEIEVPQDRDGSFEPKVVKKRQKDISGIEQKIIALYAKGMTTRQISETIEDIYGFEVSDGMVSDITDRLLPQIEDWQKRPLDEVYPIVFIDAVHFSVRDNGQIRKLAAYVILAVSMTGHKEVLSIHIGENESAKYWLGVLNELKNRGVKDILVICADGLTGMKEAVSAAFPQTELQRCIVHQVRNTLKYVGEKNKKEFANDLKTIYHAPSEDAALEALDRVTEKWEDDYPNAMKSWYKNWDVISPIFKFSSDVRKVIYTTNAIESLNSGYRRLNKQRSVFPSDTALLKALYLATHEIAKKWTMPLRNWGKVLGELEIMYPDRIG